MRALLFPDLQDYSIVLNPNDFKRLFARRQIVDWLIIVFPTQQKQKLSCVEMYFDDISTKVTRVWVNQGFIKHDDGIFLKDSVEKFEIRIFFSLLKKIESAMNQQQECRIKFANKSKLYFYHKESVDGQDVINIYDKALKKM